MIIYTLVQILCGLGLLLALGDVLCSGVNTYKVAMGWFMSIVYIAIILFIQGVLK